MLTSNASHGQGEHAIWLKGYEDALAAEDDGKASVFA